MRITNHAVFNRLTADINRAADRLLQQQRQVGSAKRLVTASDDPVNAGLAISIRQSLARLRQSQRDADHAEARLQTSAEVLTDIISDLGDMKDLAFRARAGTLTLSDMQDLAAQVNHKLEQVVADANARSTDGYLFGGTQTDVVPFTAMRDVDGDITLVTVNASGIDGTVRSELSVGLQITVNVPGSIVFISTSPETVDIFPLLIAVRDQLRSGDVAGLEASLNALETASNQVRVAAADVGDRIGTIREARQRAENDLLALKDRLSKSEDADMAEVSIEFERAQYVYQAALAAASRIGQINLVNFLR